MFRKLALSCSVAALLGLPAHAGGPVEVVPEVDVVVEQPSSSAAGIVVPLLLLALIVAAAAGGGSGDPQDSDRRIKTDLEWVAMSGGLPVWRYRYIGRPERFEGVMAQDVRALRPDAVETRTNGVMAVRYDRLGLTLRQVA